MLLSSLRAKQDAVRELRERCHTVARVITASLVLFAGIPLLNVTCGDGIEIHADKGGSVCIDGQEGKPKKLNDN
jgi:hypothetical protein